MSMVTPSGCAALVVGCMNRDLGAVVQEKHGGVVSIQLGP